VSVRNLQRALLERYSETQVRHANSAAYADARGAWPYYETNYARALAGIPRDGRILELGCGPGNLLAWLRNNGWTHVEGVDASPGDVAIANEQLGAPLVIFGDALDHLSAHPGSFDLVIAKAVIEHIPKDRLLPLVAATAAALKPGGCAVIDVPNMDWLLASHERYMDLTHEVGFTRESLASLLSLAFTDVAIDGSQLAIQTRSQRLLRPLLIRTLRRTLYVLGEGASDLLFSSRSLIAVARSPLPEFPGSETFGSLTGRSD